MSAYAAIDARQPETVGRRPRRWRGEVERLHGLAAAAVLGGAVLVALCWAPARDGATAWGGAALLVGGALVGVPHGSSDFVVAHRALKPFLGRGWLPAFLVGYLAIVGLVLLGWTAAPLATLLGFVALSCLHFGLGDLSGGDLGAGRRRHGFALAVRATTPLLPVLLAHPQGLTGLVALLGGAEDAVVAGVLDGLRWPLLLPWGLAVACYVIPRASGAGRGPAGDGAARDALEVGAIAVAAVVLPPLLAFALYFCLVHALRHMIGIADDVQPDDPRRAMLLVAAIVVPSALACLLALALAWNGIAGPLATRDVLVWSLRLIAALTVPHMALEAWAERLGRGRRD